MVASRLPMFGRPTWWEWCGAGTLLATAIAFGVVVEIRSAYSERRHTDLGIYLRGAWATRNGEDPYTFTTENGCHYNYPPLFAILLVPFAEAPANIEAAGTVPFAVSVALWYAFSLTITVWAVHALARALERTSSDPAVRRQALGSRRWWALRVLPVLVCLPGIARTLALGQVDLLVLLLLCGTAAAAMRGRSWCAGLCLAGAVCIKVIPAFLLLYPLWRRDGRWLAGCALGLMVGWGVIPALVWGPQKAWDYHIQWAEAVILPPFGQGEDRSRDADLTSLAAVNSQSLVGILHNYQYPIHDFRPPRPTTVTLGAALLLGGVLTLATLLAARRQSAAGLRTAICIGTLVVLMLLVAPVCHPHYSCHWLLLTMGLLAWDWDRRGNRGLNFGLLSGLLGMNLVTNVATSVPRLEVLRDYGLATIGGVGLVVAGIVVNWRGNDDIPQLGLVAVEESLAQSVVPRPDDRGPVEPTRRAA
jgi:hypothetical protein